MLISDDLVRVLGFVERIAVMYLGKIVEIGLARYLFDAPSHPYTHALIAAAPTPDPVQVTARDAATLRGELPCQDARQLPVSQRLPAADADLRTGGAAAGRRAARTCGGLPPEYRAGLTDAAAISGRRGGSSGSAAHQPPIRAAGCRAEPRFERSGRSGRTSSGTMAHG